MNKFLLSASAVAVFAGVLSLSGSAWAQASQPAAAAAAAKPQASADPHKVALIDMAYVFKNYKKFENLREDLKAEITKSEAEAKEMADQIQQLQKEMKSLREGSPDFTEREQQFAKLSAEFETFRRAAQREFLKKESQIYHTVYMEVADAVQRYASYYKYTLVMRFSRDELDTENAQKLIEGMNRQVVYHRPEDDITLAVVEYLNKKFAGAATGTAAPAGGAPRTARQPQRNGAN